MLPERKPKGHRYQRPGPPCNQPPFWHGSQKAVGGGGCAGNRGLLLRTPKAGAGQEWSLDERRCTIQKVFYATCPDFWFATSRRYVIYIPLNSQRLFPPTAGSFGVSAQIGSGVVRGGPEVRFHEGSTRVPPGFHQGTRFCGVVRALRAPHAVGDIT